MLGWCLSDCEKNRWGKGFERHLVRCSCLGPEYRNPFIQGGGDWGGGSRLARWIHLCGPANTNSSFETRKTFDVNKIWAIVSHKFIKYVKSNYNSNNLCLRSSMFGIGSTVPTPAQLGFLRQNIWLAANTFRAFGITTEYCSSKPPSLLSFRPTP